MPSLINTVGLFCVILLAQGVVFARDLTRAEVDYLNAMGSIKLCVGPDTMPLETIRDGQHIGMNAEYMEIFSHPLPVPIQLVVTSTWDESMARVNSGECDIISLIAETEERKAFLEFTDPYVSIPFVIVTTQDKFFISKLSGMAEKKLGMVKGYAYVEILRNLYPEIEVVEVTTRKEGLEKVNSGEIYGFLSGLYIAGYAIQEGQYTNLKINGHFDELNEIKLGIGVNKNRRELVPIFNRLIANLSDEDRKRIDHSWRKVQFEVSENYQRITWVLLGVLVLFGFFLVWQIQLRKHNRQLAANEKEIWTQANFDFLTGLPNRRLFQDRLNQKIQSYSRNRTSFALLLIDLDEFKEVNDTLGHDLGDELLIQAAKRLEACLRNSDTTARLGGDEFVVIVGDLVSERSVEKVVDTILKELSRPFVIHNEKAYVSASVGITLFPQDCQSQMDGITLLKNADQAMYAAKKEGRNTFHYFTPTMHEHAVNRMQTINDLREAQKNNDFRLYYQPIVNLKENTVHKAEALIRWHHPEKGIIAPYEFIPILEETKMVNEVGHWVFLTAVAQADIWRKTYNSLFQISVNISPVQFRLQGTKDWNQVIASYSLSGNCVSIEITETMLMESDISNDLTEMRSNGMQVSLDDFGVGYSSLSYLRKFPIDYLKIDRSFVSHLAEDSDDFALCEAIVTMAHRLGILVIAEGVETAEQLNLLRRMNCDYAQGYLFSKPVPAEEFEKFLQSAPELLQSLAG